MLLIYIRYGAVTRQDERVLEDIISDKKFSLRSNILHPSIVFQSSGASHSYSNTASITSKNIHTIEKNIRKRVLDRKPPGVPPICYPRLSFLYIINDPAITIHDKVPLAYTNIEMLHTVEPGVWRRRPS